MIYERIIEKALALWHFEAADYHLISERENRVYRVDYQGKTFVLRIHRQGYHNNKELWSELLWMAALAKGGLCVPSPVLSSLNKFLHIINGHQITFLTWLTGLPIGKTAEPLKQSDRIGLFQRIGRKMAQMHSLADAWTAPKYFIRCHWNRVGLLGENPIWGRFWDNPTLSRVDRTLFLRIREVADEKLKDIESKLDYGLIHADLVHENILVDGKKVQFIDFDDSGFGFRLFDLATTLNKNLNEPDYPALRSALLGGYLSERNIDLTSLDLILLIRAATYIGWIIKRFEETGSKVRNERFIQNTRNLAQIFLSGG